MTHHWIQTKAGNSLQSAKRTCLVCRRVQYHIRIFNHFEIVNYRWFPVQSGGQCVPAVVEDPNCVDDKGLRHDSPLRPQDQRIADRVADTDRLKS